MSSIGKLSAEAFSKILVGRCGSLNKNVLTGPGYGVDVSVVKSADNQCFIMASDPLSIIPTLGMDRSAYLSLHLCCNDIATTGFAPQYAQVVLNLPESLSENDFLEYWTSFHQYAEKIGISITGGHTGQISGINATVVGGLTLFAEAPHKKVLRSYMASSGDRLIVTKSCALSATAILCLCFPETISRHLGSESLLEAQQLFWNISSLRDGLIAAEDHPSGRVSAMHDITEGGLFGAAAEMAVSSGLGLELYAESFPVLPITQEVCRLFKLDPRCCLGSGSMLISCKEKSLLSVTEKLHHAGIAASVIGEFTDRHTRLELLNNYGRSTIPIEKKDPYWEAYFNAVKKGWQ